MGKRKSRQGSNEMTNRVIFTIGNTYRRISRGEADLDRSGRFHKTHEWTLFVEVREGHPDCLERVIFDLGSTFQPQTFACTCPVPTENGGWRFATKQQSYGLTTAKITLRGAGGTSFETTYQITDQSDNNNQRPRTETFEELRPFRAKHYLKFAETQNFGIELELSSPVTLQPQRVAQVLSSLANVGEVIVVDDYREGRETNSRWKIVPDSSIMCSPSLPDCNKYELVSPVLQGGHGLSQVNRVLRALDSVELKVNKSMGFHLHIDVEQLSLQELIKVCQNFVKYEDVVDSFMPPSRRTGSSESDQYFHSNRASVGPNSSNKARHVRIARCRSLAELIDVMNVNGNRYYKLNMQNLATGRQPTLEFRQHSATTQYSKVNAWVRFCSALVSNSARLAAPSAFAPNKPLNDQVECLFQYVIKDRALRDFFRERQVSMAQLGGGHEDDYCCSNCASGGSCAAVSARSPQKKRRGQ